MPHASNRAHMRTHALTPDRRRGQPRAETNKSHVARRLSRLSRAHASRRRSAAPPRVISTAPQRIPPKHQSAPSLAHRPISNFASLHSLAGLLAVFLLRALPRHAAQSRAAACRGVPQRAAACRSVPRKSLGLCSATSTHVWRRPRALKRWQRDSVPPAPASGAMMAARRAPNRSPAGKRPWPAWDVGGSQAWVWQWTGQGGARGAAGQSWTTDALDVHTRAGGRGAGRRQGRRRPLGAAPGRIGRRSTRRALAAARAPPDSQSPP